jgi:hypothetical protein
VRVAVEALEDEHRGDLRLERQIAGDQDDRTDLADRAGERHREAGQDAREDVRKDDPPERLELTRPERARGLLHLRVELEQHRLHGPHHERQRHEEERQVDRPAGERHVRREVDEPEVDVERRLDSVEGDDHEADHDRRQGERQVDDRVDETLAAEVVPNEHPRDHRPEHAVRERGERRHRERQLQRRERLRRGDDVPEPVGAVPRRRPDERRDRQRDDDREEGRDEPEREGRAGPLAQMDAGALRPEGRSLDDGLRLQRSTLPGSSRSSP